MHLSGSITALATPFTVAGEIDFEAWRHLLDSQVAGGTRAVVVAGSTGEAALLEESERVMLADTPVLPLYFYVNKHLVKPYVQGWQDNVMNVQYSKELGLGSGT